MNSIADLPPKYNLIYSALPKPKNEILNSTTTFGGGIYSRTVKVYSFI
jgi:predicted outer membrane repeat protein